MEDKKKTLFMVLGATAVILGVAFKEVRAEVLGLLAIGGCGFTIVMFVIFFVAFTTFF